MISNFYTDEDKLYKEQKFEILSEESIVLTKGIYKVKYYIVNYKDYKPCVHYINVSNKTTFSEVKQIFQNKEDKFIYACEIDLVKRSSNF
jgi:hypothetical protein